MTSLRYLKLCISTPSLPARQLLMRFFHMGPQLFQLILLLAACFSCRLFLSECGLRCRPPCSFSFGICLMHGKHWGSLPSFALFSHRYWMDCFAKNSQQIDKDVYMNGTRVDIIFIFLACLFVDVLVEVITLLHKSSCAPLLGSSGRLVGTW